MNNKEAWDRANQLLDGAVALLVEDMADRPGTQDEDCEYFVNAIPAAARSPEVMVSLAVAAMYRLARQQVSVQ
jgi:hypothetical protein